MADAARRARTIGVRNSGPYGIDRPRRVRYCGRAWPLTIAARFAAGGTLLLALAGCDESPRPKAAAADGASGAPITLPQPDQRLCTAVVILLDTSMSMLQEVPDRGGTRRPKHQIARDALGQIIDRTSAWKAAHPDRPLELGILRFSSAVTPLLPMGPFDQAAARTAIENFTVNGGTAIGRALESGYQALYQTGCVRKHVICITDGENTSGPDPAPVARKFFEATHGEVELHFVAFDTSSKKFGFLSAVNGSVVEARDGAQLGGRLSDIYERRILVEEMPAEHE